MLSLKHISDCKIEEISGFLKSVCQQNEERKYTIFKCRNSDQYYTYNRDSLLQFRGDACSDDPHYYQACDKRTGGQIVNGKVLCEHYFCKESGFSLLTSAELSAGERGSCTYDCENTDINKEGCVDEGEEARVILPSGQKARPTEICNEICDAYKCEDEALCNGYQYGVYCMQSWADTLIIYVRPIDVCDSFRSVLKEKTRTAL